MKKNSFLIQFFILIFILLAYFNISTFFNISDLNFKEKLPCFLNKNINFLYALNNDEQEFYNYLLNMEKIIPEKFFSKIFTNLFDEDIKGMPDNYFINKKNIYFTINYEKNKEIKIDAFNIKDDYKTYFISKLSNDYFFIFFKGVNYIKEIFNGYEFKKNYDKDKTIFLIKEDNSDFSYYIIFDNNKIFTEMLVKMKEKDFIKINFFYMIKNNYLYPKNINIYFYETKEEIYIKFVDFKILKN